MHDPRERKGLPHTPALTTKVGHRLFQRLPPVLHHPLPNLEAILLAPVVVPVEPAARVLKHAEDEGQARAAP